MEFEAKSLEFDQQAVFRNKVLNCVKCLRMNRMRPHGRESQLFLAKNKHAWIIRFAE